MINSTFNDDECRLVLTMFNKNIFDMFLPLGIAQSAPPVFMLFSKIAANISDYNEYFLKFIPLLSGFLSLFIFYKIAKKYFENNISVLLATLLISVNFNLVVYSSIFKQYSVDVLSGLICFYCFYNIYNCFELSKKHLLLLAFLIIVLPFCSLASVFFIIPFLIFYILKNRKNKDIYLKLFGILVISGVLFCLYYIFNLLPSSAEMKQYYGNMWNEGFWNTISGFFKLLILNLKYYINPNKLILFPLILFCCGLITAFLEKPEKKNMTVFILSVIFTVALTSFFEIYPFIGRITLFLTPFFIMLCIKSFDYLLTKKNLLIIPVSLLIIAGFFEYLTPYYYHNLFTVNHSPDKLMKILKERYNTETDVILFNSASDSSFIFYSYKNGFYPDKKYEIPYKPVIKDAVLKYLNGLDNNNGYWFYLVKDFSSEIERGYVLDWLKYQKTDYYTKDRDSYLYHISPHNIKRISNDK